MNSGKSAQLRLYWESWARPQHIGPTLRPKTAQLAHVKIRMGRRALTDEDYDRLVKCFREDGPNQVNGNPRWTTIERLTGLSRNTVTKAWHLGWPKKRWEPIKTVFEREQYEARARIKLEQDAKREQLRKEREASEGQAVESRAEEGQMVQMARGGALEVLTASKELTAVAHKLAELAKERLEQEVANERARKPTTKKPVLAPTQALNLLSRIIDAQSKINDLAHKAMVMERLHLGQPGEIKAVIVDGHMTVEEAETRIASATAALESAKAAGGLEVLEGGQTTPKIGKAVDVV